MTWSETKPSQRPAMVSFEPLFRVIPLGYDSLALSTHNIVELYITISEVGVFQINVLCII